MLVRPWEAHRQIFDADLIWKNTAIQGISHPHKKSAESLSDGGADKNVEDASTLDTFSLEMFENIAYVMAKHADANIPDTPEEWLDGFNTFSIYQVLPQLIELWGLNVQTDVSAKKTSSNRSLDDNTFIFASLRTDGD